jgi:DNA-binding CsgD family transcriptional regulator
MFQTSIGLLYLQARGRYHMAIQRRHAALADFNACGRLMTRWELDLPALAPWRTEIGYCRLDQGDDTAEARQLAYEQLALVGEGGGRVRGMTLRALAATCDLQERVPLLREATEVLRDCGDQLELAHTLADLSRTLGMLGDHGKARTVAQRAHHIATFCVADPLRRSLLGADEKPPAEPVDERLAELSEAELRVAALASQGHTNRQIANRLYITVSTVEQHLTRIYRKLNVKRRADLPLSALTDEPLTARA